MTRAAFTRRPRGDRLGQPEHPLRPPRAEVRRPFGDDWERCVEQAVLDMKADLAGVVGG